MYRKLARCISALILSALLLQGSALAAVNLDEVICLPVVMYHAVRPGDSGKDAITPQEFESDLKFYRDSGYTAVTMRDLARHMSGEQALPEKPIILSFDDGYYNNYKYVYPLLREYDTRIVMSVITKAMDDFTETPSTNAGYAHMTWGQLREMVDSGHAEVQNHSHNLHKLGKSRIGCGQKKGESFADYSKVLSEDIEKSQLRIYEMTGIAASTFAYPYGKYNDNTVTILKELGLAASLSCDHGVNLISKSGETDLFNLKRICRAHNQSAEKVIKDAMRTLDYR